jgi:hypothetical protein
MDNVQNCDSYINIPSSQTYSSEQMYKATGWEGRHFVQMNILNRKCEEWEINNPAMFASHHDNRSCSVHYI